MGFFSLFFLSGQPCYLSELVEIRATCLSWEAHIRCKCCCLPTCCQVGRRRADSFTQSGFITDRFIYETLSSFIHNIRVSVKWGCADARVHTLHFFCGCVCACWNARSGLHGRTLWNMLTVYVQKAKGEIVRAVKKILLTKFLFNPKVKSQSVVTSSIYSSTVILN